MRADTNLVIEKLNFSIFSLLLPLYPKYSAKYKEFLRSDLKNSRKCSIYNGIYQLGPLLRAAGKQKFYIKIIHASMDTIAEICNVPMILNGKSAINIGRTVKITAQTGNAATPDTMATIRVMINTR